MRKLKHTILYILVLLTFNGCLDVKFNGTDASIEKMMVTMSEKERMLFFKDIILVIEVIGENKTMGYNVEDIKNEAQKIREFSKDGNIKFLKNKITEMQRNNQKVTYLHINTGFISNSREGYIYNKKYSINDLKSIISHNGDIEKYAYIQEAKIGFIKGCLKTKGFISNTCECVWSELISKFNIEGLKMNGLKPTKEFTTFLNNSSVACFNKNQ